MDRDGNRLTLRPGPLLAAVPLLFLGLFFLYPLIRILVRSLTLDGGLDLSPFLEIATKGSLRRTAWFTLWQAAASTLLTLAFALPGAYVIARYRFPGRNLLRAAVTVPFVLPTVVAGTAFLALLGPGGPLGFDLRDTAWAILAAHVFFNYAVVVRMVGTFWEMLDPRLEEAARVLGAGRLRAFRTATLPLLAPSVYAAASIIFLFSFTSFGVVLILGGFGYATLEVVIWQEAVIQLDLAAAAALAVLQLAGVGAALAAYGRFARRRARRLRLLPGGTARPPRGAAQKLTVAVVLASMAAYLGAPIAVLIWRSLRTGGGGWGWDNYRNLARGGTRFVEPLAAMGNSLWFAAVAAAGALLIGLTASVVIARFPGRLGPRLDSLLMLPLGASAVTIGFGFLVAFDRPVDLRASAWLIPLAHTVVAVPFVIRSVVPPLRAVRADLWEAAATLGASPRRVFREIDLPVIRKAALVGAGFACAVSLGEFGATAFLIRPDRPTIPTAIFRLLGQPGAATLGQAMALSVVLMVLTTAVIMLIESRRTGNLGDF